MAVDEQRLNAFLGKAVGDLGAAVSAVLVSIGDELGFYKALAADHSQPESSRPPPAPTSGMSANGSPIRQPAATWSMTPRVRSSPSRPSRRSAWRTERASRCTGRLLDRARSVSHARSGAQQLSHWNRHGMGRASPVPVPWHRALLPRHLQHQPAGFVAACARWRGRQAETRVRVADVGCGHGASTILMAQAFPKSTFVGIDYHESSIETAQQRATAAGISNIGFEVADATSYKGEGYDLIAFFDCVHDMADPAGAARHARETLQTDGHVMVVEPFATIAWRTISIRWAAFTTAHRRWCACPYP